MKNNLLEEIYNEYSSNFTSLSEYGSTLEKLVETLLKNEDLSYHSIGHRIKEEVSFKTKLKRKQDKYKSLHDITDLVGIRIITYYADDVDKIAKIIEDEFEIDWDNSIDKRKMLDPDRFGYLSLHYIVTMKEERLGLKEYEKFRGYKAEIQIRSILQHAWAEIEHDLGYKSSFDIPQEIKRDFYRLAGLLEIGDKEFKEIRKNISRYSEDIELKIDKSPEKILIDKESLEIYIERSDKLRKLSNKIAENVGATLTNNKERISETVNLLHFVDVRTIKDIEENLEKYSEISYKFSKKMFDGKEHETLDAEIGLFYLCYVKVAMTNSEEFIYQYLERNKIGDDTEELAEEILKIYNELDEYE